MAANKFLETLKKKPRSSQALVQTIIPGAKTRGNCNDGCLILKNCQILNKRLISVLILYREHISQFLNTSPRSYRRRQNNNTSYEYQDGYSQCSNDISGIVNKMFEKEDHTIMAMQSILAESYALIQDLEDHNQHYSRRARAIRLRYDKLYRDMRGEND